MEGSLSSRIRLRPEDARVNSPPSVARLGGPARWPPGRPAQRPPGAASAKENERARGARAPRSHKRVLLITRLPATDILALASVKNVAKCDMWFEWQNPANHRIFERKLRPRPSSRGHACLGVTRPAALRVAI